MIISASRRTDIPAFYPEWFINRIKAGYVLVKNPMNERQVSKISLSPDVVDCIVFWTKNPDRIMKYLPFLEAYNYYFQITITSYDKSIEPDVLLKKDILETVKKLSDQIGPEKVIWRYDPIFYTEKFDYDWHLKYFEKIAAALKGRIEKCIISFLDLYKKCEKNMRGINYRLLNNDDIFRLAPELAAIAQGYAIKLESCAEELDLEAFGIKHAKCIDDDLIARIAGKAIKVSKDKNQRGACNCVQSIDIGAYNTCPHNCLYCYANLNKDLVKGNYSVHNPESEILCGNISANAVIRKREMRSFFVHDNPKKQAKLL